MGRLTTEERQLHSQIGLHTRWGRLDEAATARTALKVARVEADLADLVETYAPTAEQRARLAAVLNCSPEEAPADAHANGGRRGIPTRSTAAH